MSKRVDYIFNKEEVIHWITNSEPVLHCNDCKYYDLLQQPLLFWNRK